MNILISGGSGFIGEHLKIHFESQGHKVVTIGLNRNNHIIVDLVHNKFNFIQDFDLIIHCAGIVHSNKHISSINSELVQKDINITSNFLLSIGNIKYEKFIYLSSVSVYGLESGTNISTSTKLNANTGYGLSKIICEHLISNIIEPNKFLIIRLPLVYGNNPKGNINKIIKNINSGKMIIFKNNDAIKSILEISDLSNFILCNFHKYNGIIQIKSYDIFLNDFILQLPNVKNKKIYILPTFFLEFLILFTGFLFLNEYNKILKKIKYSLTFDTISY